MQISKENILRHTYYGGSIYSHILRKHYSGEAALSLRGKDCPPNRSPFSDGRRTLKFEFLNGALWHTDLEGAIPNGDAFCFAALYYDMEGSALLHKLNEDMCLQIGKENTYPKNPFFITQVNFNFMPVSKALFSYYKAPVSNPAPEFSITPAIAYKLIKGSFFQEATEKLRAITDPKEARTFKASHFRYATFSGTFSHRSDKHLLQHSGVMVLDFDHLPDVEALKAKLIEDEQLETVLLFTSPSGNGLKWVIEVDLSGITHADMFRAVSNYVQETYKVQADPSGKDLSRACFLPHDPAVYLNPKYF